MNEGILLKELLETDKVEDVRRLLEEYTTANQETSGWRALGDRPNNSGTVQAAGDPMRALVERVTNAIDAVIERAHREHKGKPECTSPKEAAAAWFGIPSDGLHKMSDAARRKLAQDSVTLTLLPGDSKARRTVDIGDKGVGVTADRLPKTILSLNESNKLDKFYLSGAFGQGGSATFASSEFTLVASRSIETPGVIGFSVVKYEPPKGMKLGSYVYLTKTSAVLTTTDVPTAFADYSTRIRHYGYDLDDYGGKIGPNSVYGRAQTILFDPVLPFWLRTEVHGFGRTIKGVRAALNGAKDDEDDESKLAHSNPLFFSDLGEFGQIGIEYWVLEPAESKAPANRAFVNSARPIVVSVNGQLHAEWSANILRKDADLLHIAGRMVVHLDCNRLSLDAKNALFVSNREESRKGLLQNLILTELVNALKSDETLRQLNEEARTAGWKQKDEEAEKEVRREVARMLKLFGFATSEEIGAKKTSQKAPDGGSPTGKPPKGKPEPIQPNEPPTFVSFVGEKHVDLFPGQRRFLRLRTDAHSGYHSATDPAKSRFSFIVEGEKVRFVGSTELRGGHLRAIIAADTEAVVGTTGTFTVEVRPPSAQTLSDAIAFSIVPAPEPKSASSKISLPEIDIAPIDGPEDPEWSNLGWSLDPAEVSLDYTYAKEKDILTIRYSSVFPRLKATLDQLSGKGGPLADSFRKRYEIWLITSVIIHWQDTLSDPTPLAMENLEDEAIDNYRRDELRRMSKAAIMYAQREVTQAGIDVYEPE